MLQLQSPFGQRPVVAVPEGVAGKPGGPATASGTVGAVVAGIAGVDAGVAGLEGVATTVVAGVAVAADAAGLVPSCCNPNCSALAVSTFSESEDTIAFPPAYAGCTIIGTHVSYTLDRVRVAGPASMSHNFQQESHTDLSVCVP